MKKFQMLLNDVAAITGLESLVPDESGGCAIRLDDVILNIQFMEDTRQCYFFSQLFQIPALEKDRLSLYERLLSANCFYRETGGGILGIDTDINAVTYATKFGIDAISGNDFVNFVESFINMAESFIEKFSNGVSGADQNDTFFSGDMSHFIRV